MKQAIAANAPAASVFALPVATHAAGFDFLFVSCLQCKEGYAYLRP